MAYSSAVVGNKWSRYLGLSNDWSDFGLEVLLLFPELLPDFLPDLCILVKPGGSGVATGIRGGAPKGLETVRWVEGVPSLDMVTSYWTRGSRIEYTCSFSTSTVSWNKKKYILWKLSRTVESRRLNTNTCLL